ncbi:hypothetical protein Q9Q95_14460 [Sphingomonas sp. DG1-23]|uniref:hypothetical protein n=1 Tax=Sphingomonas sp. DG1-23 TaxID=3068316 RepID=UPI0027402130|nr:hypothetical protein [Sphingomonas sp. DG1-23]MDP5280129.1 hypothetical protein [Sphingomonas sp. DG1-23]
MRQAAPPPLRNGHGARARRTVPARSLPLLLTLHFLKRDERLHILREIHERLKPGAALVVAHHSIPETGDMARWLARSVAFAGGSTADIARASVSAATMAERLPVLPAGEEEAILLEAGFREVALFYAAFSFRGWVAWA